MKKISLVAALLSGFALPAWGQFIGPTYTGSNISPVYWQFSAKGYVQATGQVLNEEGQPIWVEIDPDNPYLASQQTELADQPPPDAELMSGAVYRAALQDFESFKASDEPYADRYQILDIDTYNAKAGTNFGTVSVQRPGASAPVSESIVSPPVAESWVKSVVIRDPGTVTDPQTLPSTGLILLKSPIALAGATTIGSDIVAVIVDAQGNRLYASDKPLGFKTDYFDPPLETPRDRSLFNPAFDEQVLNPIAYAKVYQSIDTDSQTTSASSGGYRLSYLTAPCPCTAVEYDSQIVAEIPYTSFNPKSPSGRGFYPVFTHQYDVCNGYAYCDIPAPTFGLGGAGGTLGNMVAGIIAAQAIPLRPRRDLKVDSVLVTGQGRVGTPGQIQLAGISYDTSRKTYDPGAGFTNCAAGGIFATDFDGDQKLDAACLGQIPEQAERLYVYLGGKPPVAVQPGDEDVPCDYTTGNCRFIDYDLIRAPDSAPDLSDRGLLKTLSAEDLSDTDIYLFRVATGELLAERLGLQSDDVDRYNEGQASGDEPAFSYRMLLRGEDYLIRRPLNGIGAERIKEEVAAGASTRGSLSRGEQIQVIAINRPTGYIGSVTVGYDKDGLQLQIPQITLGPPNLKIRASRKRVDELGLTQGDEAIHLITGEGAGLTDDQYIQIETEWFDQDGRPLPAGLADNGYSALMVKTVEGGQLVEDTACGADAANLTIRPGVQKQLLKLDDNCGLQAEHYYLYVCGYPQHRAGRSKCYDFSAPGRPNYYTPVKVPILDEQKTREQDRAWRYLLDANPDNDTAKPEPVYQWVTRPEFEFSVFGLTVDAINRIESDGSAADVSQGALPGGADPNSLIALFYDLLGAGGDNAIDPLETYGPDSDAERGLLFVLGEEEVPVLLGQDNIAVFPDLEQLAQLDVEDYLTLRLIQNQDPTNVLWQFAFKTDGCDIGANAYDSTDMSVPGQPALMLDRSYCTSNLPSASPVSSKSTLIAKSAVASTPQEFGIGSGHNYSLYLRHAQLDGSGDKLELVFPKGESIQYERVSGASVRESVYTHTETPGAFFHSRLAYDDALDAFVLIFRDGTQYRFEATDGSRLIAMIDRNGNTVSIERQAGLIQAVRAPHGRAMTFEHDAEGRIVSATDQSGRAVTYSYDAGGRLAQANYPDGTHERYEYDDADRLTRVVDRRGNDALRTGYDAQGRLKHRIAADGGIARFEYEEAGSGVVDSRKTLDARGVARLEALDRAGFRIRLTEAVGTAQERTTRYERDADTHQLSAMVDPLGRRTAYHYNAGGDLIELVELSGSGAPVRHRFEYDADFHQVTAYTDPLGHTTRMGYDNKGNLIRITDPSGRSTRLTHDGQGRVIAVTDALNQVLRIVYDGADLASLTDPLNRTTNFQTDDRGRITAVTDARGTTTHFTYDEQDRLTETLDALGGRTTLAYDAGGNLTAVTDPRRLGTHRFGYDSTNRNILYVDPLDQQTQDVFGYDNNGNLISATDRKGQTTSYSYDALNRLTDIQYADGGQIQFTWDAADRLTQIDDSTTGLISREYDERDRLIRETSPQGEVSYSYDAANRRTGMLVNGQSAFTYSYDEAGRLLQVSHPQATATYSYDAIGRLSSVDLPNSITARYSYDAASQLTGIVYTQDGSPLGDLSYSYDEAGRRISQSGSLAKLGSAQDFSASFDAANRLTQYNSEPLSYDLNGNLIQGLGQSYSWNARDQLTQVGSSQYQYDALGRRTQRNLNGQITNYLHDGANPIQVNETLMLTGQRLDGFAAEITPDGTKSYITDALGSILATDDSPSGQANYSPYGVTTNSQTAFAYTGREQDAEGLYYYRARYYLPTMGRFVSEDPIGLGGGLNFYSYVGSDPITWIDPLGLFESSPWLRALVPGQVFYDSAMTAIENGDYAMAAANFMGMVSEQALTVGSFGLYRGLTRACSVQPAKGMSVLGKYPDYIQLADKLGAKRFSIPPDVWNKMSKAEQWAANQKFLDRMIARGDDIILSNPVKNIDDVSGAFRQELDYLMDQGFRLSRDGTRMVR